MKEPRVLIIESNDVLRVMLFTILRHQPVAVDTAANGDDALTKVSHCDYALLLIDTNMPDGEAEEFLRAFAEFRPDATTFIIAVRDGSADEILMPNVAAVLTKPLEIDTLAEVVRECAAVVPPPEDPLPCPPAESEVRARMDQSGSFYSN